MRLLRVCLGDLLAEVCKVGCHIGGRLGVPRPSWCRLEDHFTVIDLFELIVQRSLILVFPAGYDFFLLQSLLFEAFKVREFIEGGLLSRLRVSPQLTTASLG